MGTRKHSTAHYVRSVLSQTWSHPSNRGRRGRAIAGALAWQVRKRVGAGPRDVPFFGWRLRCHPDSNSASNVVYFTERYDPAEMGFMIAFLRRGDGFIDVGANIGTYSLLAAALVGPAGRVDAFEAHATAVGRLRENLALNGISSVTVHEAAVADREGTVHFLQTFDVSNSILTPVDAGAPVSEVVAVTLDGVLGDRPAAMGKLDIEGFETAALRGAVARLAAADPPVWQVEVMDHQLRKAGSSAAELVGLLTGAGFDLVRFDPVTGALHPIDPSDPPVNVWAVHETMRRWVEDRLAGAAAPLGTGGAR